VNIFDAISFLEKDLETGRDIPEPLWFFFSRHTPIVNVDLLVRNYQKQILLSWRNDQHGNKGWHIPGGVIRYKETWAHRIQQVAINELGLSGITHQPNPTYTNEIFWPTKTRGHFISLAFWCECNDIQTTNTLKWFDKWPENMIECQLVYKRIDFT
jgi:colanic acid biosynthesis protein WcaH